MFGHINSARQKKTIPYFLLSLAALLLISVQCVQADGLELCGEDERLIIGNLFKGSALFYG